MKRKIISLKQKIKPPQPKIGILGGVGPYAGTDLANKIMGETIASSDQDHLPFVLFSYPQIIKDRTAFLSGNADENPGNAFFAISQEMEVLQIPIAGIPCNTAHAHLIFDAFQKQQKEQEQKVEFLHLIQETVPFIKEHCFGIKKIGILSTNGTYKAKLYPKALEKLGYEIITLDWEDQNRLHTKGIFDPTYGIKAQSSPVTDAAKQIIQEGVDLLQKKGVEAVILACTELPLAITEKKQGELYLLDPTVILARALIKKTYPDKLKPWSWKK